MLKRILGGTNQKLHQMNDIIMSNVHYAITFKQSKEPRLLDAHNLVNITVMIKFLEAPFSYFPSLHLSPQSNSGTFI